LECTPTQMRASASRTLRGGERAGLSHRRSRFGGCSLLRAPLQGLRTSRQPVQPDPAARACRGSSDAAIAWQPAARTQAPRLARQQRLTSAAALPAPSADFCCAPRRPAKRPGKHAPLLSPLASLPSPLAPLLSPVTAGVCQGPAQQGTQPAGARALWDIPMHPGHHAPAHACTGRPLSTLLAPSVARVPRGGYRAEPYTLSSCSCVRQALPVIGQCF
jgi:hypothetical protein